MKTPSTKSRRGRPAMHLRLTPGVLGLAPTGTKKSQRDWFRETYWDHPELFAIDCIDWGDSQPTPYQIEIMREFYAHKRGSVRGPHGLGKTAIAAILILWFALTRDGERDWKIITTASAWRQVTKYLWPEVKKWSRRVRWDIVGRPPFVSGKELQKHNLRLETGEASGVVSDDHETIEGAHGDSIMYMFDESKAIPDPTFDAAEGALAGVGEGREALALAISTPGDMVGRFYEIHSRAKGLTDWWVRHVTLEECVAAGRVSHDWAEQRAEQWGVESAVYRNRVLGEFASNEKAGLIPLEWIEQANQRWLEYRDEHAGERKPPLTALAVDVARQGDDPTVLAYRYDWFVDELDYKPYTPNTVQVAGYVVEVVRREPHVTPVIDAIGIGAGVVDIVQDKGIEVIPWSGQESTTQLDRNEQLGFINRRAAAMWGLRELLDPSSGAKLMLPPDDRLTGELTAIRWVVTSSGKYQIEAKEGLRRRLGRSTDAADAVAMVCSELTTGVMGECTVEENWLFGSRLVSRGRRRVSLAL